MRYEGNLESLGKRPLPQWYDEAKFGIFIHWGVWAIPAFAPHIGSISDAFKKDYDRAVALTPYSEWYANAIKVPGTPAAEFHAKTYGNQPYTAFKEEFDEGLKKWDPAEWAESFRKAGAKYVVLTTKHHDGYCLWPSAPKACASVSIIQAALTGRSTASRCAPSRILSAPCRAAIIRPMPWRRRVS